MKNLLLLLIFGSLFFEACKKDEYPKTVEIEYKVGTDPGVTGIASVIYSNDTGGTTIIGSAPLPFTLSFNRTVNRNDTIGFNALDVDSITEYLEIDVDGNKVAENSASGYPFVSCEASYIFP